MCHVLEFVHLASGRALLLARAEAKGWTSERTERAWAWMLARHARRIEAA